MPLNLRQGPPVLQLYVTAARCASRGRFNASVDIPPHQQQTRNCSFTRSHPFSDTMDCPAFAVPSSLPVRRNARTGAPLKMSIIPRPLGEMPLAAVYKRAQGREARVAPSFTSDLKDAASAHLFCPSEEFAAFALRLIFGHANIFEAEMESLEPAINRMLATGDVRQFVREIAKSEAFRSRFFDIVSSLRCIEICYKNLLARAPCSQAEISEKIALLNSEGYDALIDSIVDSEEYAERFGTSMVPHVSLPSSFMEGMPSFSAQMKLQLPTRGGTTDHGCSYALTTSVLAAKNAAAPVEISASYALSVPQYEPELNWMALPRSSLLKDWAANSLVLSNAAENWSGLGTPRPTGEADSPWESGWSPTPTGEKWKPGWTAPTPKSYK